MARRNALEIDLSPPTWITLEHLAEFASTAAAMTTLAARTPEWFATRFATVDGGAVALYDGDAGYDDEDPDRPGGRHRLWMVGDTWRYERSSGPSRSLVGLFAELLGPAHQLVVRGGGEVVVDLVAPQPSAPAEVEERPGDQRRQPGEGPEHEHAGDDFGVVAAGRHQRTGEAQLHDAHARRG